MTVDERLAELIDGGKSINVETLGGLSELGDSNSSPLFPYIATAIVGDWPSLSQPERQMAADLVGSAIRDGLGGVALTDTCQIVVPAASELSLTIEIKDALRSRVSAREDESSSALAAVALRWLAHLAILFEEARPALGDALTGVARSNETIPFGLAASQACAIAYDHWRDQNAKLCLERLVNTPADAEAWFALGQARLVDSLEAPDRANCLVGLDESIECFDNATKTGEQRPDARIYSHAVRFVTEWANDATADMLARSYDGAHVALGEYLLGGRGLPDQPMWVRPRFEAETAWIELVQTMHHALDSGPEGAGWYEPAIAIGALADVYRTVNSLRPRTAPGADTPSTFAELIAPNVRAPFVDHASRLALIEHWVHESDHPDAEEFVELVRRTGQVVPPKAQPPGHTQR